MAGRDSKSEGLIATFVTIVLLGALTGLILLLQRHEVVHSFDLVRDTNAIAHQPPWFGAVSNLGVLLWAVAAVCYWFAYASLRAAAPADILKSLWLGGSYSTFACLDDLFMMHEHAGQLGMGLSERAVLITHAVWLAGFVGSVMPRIGAYRWLFLVLSLCFFGGSTLVDLAGARWAAGADHRNLVFVEEVQKLFGITFWTLFAAATSYAVVVRHLRGGRLHRA